MIQGLSFALGGGRTKAILTFAASSLLAFLLFTLPARVLMNSSRTGLSGCF
jgi:hypothetical protein